MSFQKKIYLSCFVLNLILLLACSVFFYRYTANSLKQNTHDSLLTNTSLLIKELDHILEGGDRMLKELLNNQELVETAKDIAESKDNYFVNNIPVSSNFQSIFRSALISHDYNGSISYISTYYDNVGVSYETGRLPYISKATLSSEIELTNLIEQTSYNDYVLPHSDYWENNRTVFSVIRSVRNTYQQYGILALDIDISEIDNLLDEFENASDYSITLLNSDGGIAYTNGSFFSEDEFHEAYKAAVEDMQQNTFSVDDLTLSAFGKSQVSEWTLVLTTSTISYMDSTHQLLIISAILFFSLFVIMSFFLYLLTRRLTRPLKLLSDNLAHLEPGKNITPSQFSDNNDEITKLTNTVQGFLSQIYTQNKRLTEMRRRNLKAHYDAMEAQLNPHFLYNTLSVIGMTGLTNGDTTVSKMCSELAGLLRYSLSYNGQSVDFTQEISNAQSYLYIMQMRYEDTLICNWDLDPTLNSIQVPKLILQPILENCFQHGFITTEEDITPWLISVQTYCDNTYWYLSVTNNGTSFPETKRRQLCNRIHHFKLPDYQNDKEAEQELRQGFGLENTILRLNIYYQNQSFFNITYPEPGLTTVTLGGPLVPVANFLRD
ncbi:MAG: cache domain-containing sensor histidine kinase [Lachnospiraceae bacterium]